jgi:hypothetical protein
MKFTTWRVGLAVAALGLLLGPVRRSEALIALEAFSLHGTFADGATLGGNIFISELGPLSSVFVNDVLQVYPTITGGGVGGTAVFDTITSQGQIPNSSTYEVMLSGSAGTLTLEIEDSGSLSGYNGGLLNSYNGNATYPDPNAPYTSYSLNNDPPLNSGNVTPYTAAVPEPSTLTGACVTVVMSLAYAWRKRRRARVG